MLRSGVSIQRAIDVLVEMHPHHRQWKAMQLALYSGDSIPMVVSHAFPWWCPYPFYHLSMTIDTISFLDASQQYLNFRKDWIRQSCSHLIYPLFLFIFGVFLMGFIIHNLGGVVSGQWFRVILGGLCVLCCLFVFSFYYLFRQLLLIKPLDVLEICRLSLMQGWPLVSLFDALCFPKGPLKKWQNVANDAILFQSFIQAFSVHFFLPVPVFESLQMHEKTGSFLSGLTRIMPVFRAQSLSRFCMQCQCLKVGLYGCVVCFIFGIIFLIYFPMMDQYLR